MKLELQLKFLTANRIGIKFGDQRISTTSFDNPLTDKDFDDVHWYLEVYSNQYTTDVDDQRAADISARLPKLGQELYNAVFCTSELRETYKHFTETTNADLRLIVIADWGDILSLPWELLCEPNGLFLFQKIPPVFIVRSVSHKFSEDTVDESDLADFLRVLFVVSRPRGAGFIDPRNDAQPVLDALDAEGSNKVSLEFLRPPTLRNLMNRLTDKSQPKVDVIHFDGHGIFNPTELQGYLYFTRPGSWTKHRVSGKQLAEHLKNHGLKLLILSACQSATVHREGAFGTVAVQLLKAGIPSVLAMPYSVLAETTRRFFAIFYDQLGRGDTLASAMVQARTLLLQDSSRNAIERPETRLVLQIRDWFVPTLYQTRQEVALINPSAQLPSPQKTRDNIPCEEHNRFVGRQHELWTIEQLFTSGVRQVTLRGGIQFGKSCLAQEAARWLLRTKMFRAVVWLDGRSSLNRRPIEIMAKVLGCTTEPDAVRQALSEIPSLVILDHVESLSIDHRTQTLHSIISWTEIAETRLLIIQRGSESSDVSKSPNLLVLEGLDLESALAFFHEQWSARNKERVHLPARTEMTVLLQAGGCQPVFIELLAKEYSSFVGLPPEEILTAIADHPSSERWLAPVQEAFNALDDELQTWLPMLCVFEQGAMEDNLSLVTGFIDIAKQVGPEAASVGWIRLRILLESVGLIQSQKLSGSEMRYVKIHPALRPLLKSKLSNEELQNLQHQHAIVYARYALGLILSKKQQELEVAMTIAEFEMPNLFTASLRLHREGHPVAWSVTNEVLSLFARLGKIGQLYKARLLQLVG